MLLTFIALGIDTEITTTETLTTGGEHRGRSHPQRMIVVG
jgi:hypothetical protein